MSSFLHGDHHWTQRNQCRQPLVQHQTTDTAIYGVSSAVLSLFMLWTWTPFCIIDEHGVTEPVRHQRGGNSCESDDRFSITNDENAMLFWQPVSDTFSCRGAHSPSLMTLNYNKVKKKLPPWIPIRPVGQRTCFHCTSNVITVKPDLKQQ